MVMERLAIKKNRKQYHGGCCCCRDLLHVILGAKYLLMLLLTTLPTSSIPPHVAAYFDTYSFPSSNVNGSLFSYVPAEGEFRGFQSVNPISTIASCINGSLLEALSSQERRYGRPIDVLSAHYYLDYTPYFQLFFVVSADDLCTPSYYLSLIAYNTETRDLNKGRVVWTANVGNPVGENACLHLSPNDSNLKLVDYDRNGSIVWQTNTPGHINAGLTITYEGNLVLYTNSRLPNGSPIIPEQQHKILWQSFDHPTDTLMVLQALRHGMKLTASTTELGNSTKTASHTLAMEKGTLTLYTMIQYTALVNNTSKSTADYSGYGYPYLVWSLNGTQEMSGSYGHAAAALCWYPDQHSNLQLAIDRLVII